MDTPELKKSGEPRYYDFCLPSERAFASFRRRKAVHSPRRRRPTAHQSGAPEDLNCNQALRSPWSSRNRSRPGQGFGATEIGADSA